ncbi:hypothetical protein TNCV_3662741 [Trichonephila clavipes]|nr:hypothetical protein TNCV_3662741 [Trichonephila clavipes]
MTGPLRKDQWAPCGPGDRRLSIPGLFCHEIRVSEAVVKITASWQACHEIELYASEDPPYKGTNATLNLPRLKVFLLSRFASSESRVSARVSSSALDRGSDYEVRR